ncbi:ATP-dependent DNA helicase RecG [Myxococcus sp. K15C18031901]|uniref:ATP-dependent DNA helicase RecG n=1 Tax=Myxococcus dinghuensis TaxID=2906761 RepID=UPI0020A83746|nr:ATP-dependent DNA helicase RecG [Myxococcus dinghuensis]MCP3101686.1 ATP-dependent DNA helicase RecG [Myxococcus dinghuensis]
MNHPLASLVGPLRYACQRDFAMLATVKGLRTVVERALAGASGVDAEALGHLRAALPYVDHADPERRKAALRRVVVGLKLGGVSLPSELEGLAATSPGPGPAAARRAAPDEAPQGGQRPSDTRGAPSGEERASPSLRAPTSTGLLFDASPVERPEPRGGGRAVAREPSSGARTPPQDGGARPAAPPTSRGDRSAESRGMAPGAASPLQGNRPQTGEGPGRGAVPGASGAGRAPSGGPARTQGPRSPGAVMGTGPVGNRARPPVEGAPVKEGLLAPVGRPRSRGVMGQGAPDGTADVRPPPGYVQVPTWKSGETAPPAPRAKVPGPRSAAVAPGAATQEKKDKAQRKKKRAVAAEASRSEAKLLSIAPRSGPLSSPLKTLGKRLGPRLISALDKKGLRRMGDILFLLPRCYEDRRRLRTIAELEPGERGVTVGTVKVADFVPGKTGRRMFRAVVGDRSGSIAATYFNAGPWLKSRFTVGKRLVLSGEVRATMSGREMAHPEIEPADDLDSVGSVHFNRIVPVYPGFERGEQRSFRELASRVGEQYAHALEDPLPGDLRRRLELMGLPEALRFIHFPPDAADLEALDAHQSPAHRRLAFDELFFLQLGMALKRQGVKAEVGVSFDVTSPRMEKARSALPFQLTGAQARVVDELSGDMARPEPMNRLVQGDVGSGKTAVAMVAALLALQDGYQVAVMAPTEILAEQHERNFRKVLGPLGFQVGLVSASGTAKAKRKVRDAVARGDIHLAVGTHALIQEDIAFAKLGLAVIDEQHRFGVLQRHSLMSKGPKPDVLVMTATPIPRTLAMTLYGDLDLSIIDQLPPGRTPITTRVFNDKQRGRVYTAIAAELEKGHQAYVVYPLVEESEKLDLEDATRGVEKLRQAFPQAQVGLLHGRMKAEEKDAVMEDFREKRLNILVCTTVVEVGVDVPNASVMVVEAAERFGLSQLHQLRGRVGRGAAASYCFLVASSARSWESTERLAVMEQSSDGFVIAEKDLEIRGPGEFLGTRQSGLPELAVANLARDGDLLSMAQVEARRILARDPEMKSPEHQGLVKALDERWEGRLALARVG